MHETHLADAASLTEGADGTHVALVAGAKGRGMKGGRIQRDTWVGSHISGLQMVTLAEQGQGVGQTQITVQKPQMEHQWVELQLKKTACLHIWTDNALFMIEYNPL